MHGSSSLRPTRVLLKEHSAALGHAKAIEDAAKPRPPEQRVPRAPGGGSESCFQRPRTRFWLQPLRRPPEENGKLWLRRPPSMLMRSVQACRPFVPPWPSATPAL